MNDCFHGLLNKSIHFYNQIDGNFHFSNNQIFNFFLLNRHYQTDDNIHHTCSILDMSGFENFQVNSFEQLCINVANEHLQYYFNEHIFLQEEQDYRTEGVSREKVEFQNNEDLIELFMGVSYN